MNVNLISYQEDALELLLYNKDTRLQGAQSLNDIKNWPYEKKMEHFTYMTKTIKSSFEFASYIFEIQGVSRNFTHQLVRTRTQSYAQESLRTVDVRDAKALHEGEGIQGYDLAIDLARENYSFMIDDGMEVQLARGILPTDILTNIIVKSDLRTLHETAKVRLCTRTQGEYQDVFKAMKAEVVKVHPWAEQFINVACVDSGMCIFPNYKECPIQEFTSFVTDDHKDLIREKWEETDHVANPVAKNGVTM